jgi:hypothetical protein
MKKRGRPSKYKPEYCEKVTEYMSQGYSKKALAALFNVNRDTLYNWTRLYPDFSDTIEIGEAKSLYFWEVMGIQGTQGLLPGFHGRTWKWNMINRFGWRN